MSRRWSTFFGLVASTTALTALSLPAAASIAIVNYGFEEPVTSTAVDGNPTGWVGGGTTGVWNIESYPVGFWNPGVLAPEGSQVAFIAHPNGPTDSLTTTSLAVTLQANTIYTLSASVGHPIGYVTQYAVELLAGSNVLAAFDNAAPEGDFARFQVVFNSAGSPFLGQPLAIRLTSFGGQTAFDDIALDAISSNDGVVPEASALLIWGGLAVAGFGGATARRRLAGLSRR